MSPDAPMKDIAAREARTQARARKQARRDEIVQRIGILEAERDQLASTESDGDEVRDRLHGSVDASAQQYAGRVRREIHHSRLMSVPLGDTAALCFFFGDQIKAGIDQLVGSGGTKEQDRISRISHIQRELGPLKNELALLGG